MYSTIECHSCGQGLLEFVIRVDTGDFYLECDECLTGFREIVDGRPGKGFFAGKVSGKDNWTACGADPRPHSRP